MGKKFQKYQVGGILKIPLGDNFHTYGQMTGDAEVAIFDAKSKRDLEIEDIIKRQILFRVVVNRDVITQFKWLKIGKAILSNELKTPQPYFIQDPLRPASFEIYLSGKIRKATKEECIGVERCAVWDANQVVERINDYYNGKMNVWVESLKLNE